MSGDKKSDDEKGGDRDPENESAETVKTAGEGLANACFAPSKRARRIVSQGKSRERLRRRIRGNEEAEENVLGVRPPDQADDGVRLRESGFEIGQEEPHALDPEISSDGNDKP